MCRYFAFCTAMQRCNIGFSAVERFSDQCTDIAGITAKFLEIIITTVLCEMTFETEQNFLNQQFKFYTHENFIFN